MKQIEQLQLTKYIWESVLISKQVVSFSSNETHVKYEDTNMD